MDIEATKLFWALRLRNLSKNTKKSLSVFKYSFYSNFKIVILLSENVS